MLRPKSFSLQDLFLDRTCFPGSAEDISGTNFEFYDLASHWMCFNNSPHPCTEMLNCEISSDGRIKLLRKVSNGEELLVNYVDGKDK